MESACQDTKLLTPHLQNVRMCSYGGVSHLSFQKRHVYWVVSDKAIGWQILEELESPPKLSTSASEHCDILQLSIISNRIAKEKSNLAHSVTVE